MSGSAKRAHDEFNGSLPGSAVLPPSRQHDNEEHGLPMVTGDLASADRVPSPVDNVVEPRPTKLPRVDYGNRFQKRWGIDDPIAGTSSDGHDSKGDARDGGLKSSIEEKGSFGDIKMINHDDNGESGPWKAESGHDGNRNAHAERVNRNTGHSSSAGWQTDAWPWMDHRKYLSEVEGNWGIGRGWDDEKWEKDAGKAAISERTSRNNAWRRDQRFEAWGPPKDYKERSSVRTGSDLRDAPHWSKRVGVKTSTHEDGELKEYDEAALEMQADFKREEKECDQERKVKDDSFKDKEERDREERPARVWGSHASNVAELGWERWDRGKEVKEKGRDKKDQNHVEREEAGAIKQELEEIDASRRTGFDVSNITQQMELERKPSKESENIKGVDIDEKERRKERDREKKIEHERLVDRKLRDQEKAVEDMSHEDSERDKEAFVNHNFHQKRRMLRSRGPSQALSRDGRPRISSKDFDGNQGASEATSIIYRPGEHMPELTKLWKEYESSKNGEGMSLVQGPTIEIRIPAKLVTTQNHQVKGSQLWGTDVYTDDSDLVAVIMHTGYYRPSACQPPFSVQELRVTVRVLPPQDGYTSTLRNNIRSRAWGAASGCSFSVEQCKIMKVSGGHIDLEPCLTRISAVAPTLAPTAMERTMTTRAASSNAYRQQRFVQEVTIQYNLCNEPWLKYSMSIVADRGLKKSQFTSARLKKGEVLYVETHRRRYELSYDGEKVGNGGFGATSATSAPVITGDRSRDKENERNLGNNHSGERSTARTNGNNDRCHQNGDTFNHYKWALCKQPLPLKVMLAKGVPLSHEFIEVLEDGLAWEEIQWSQTGVWIRDKEYPLARAQFLSQNLDNVE